MDKAKLLSATLTAAVIAGSQSVAAQPFLTDAVVKRAALSASSLSDIELPRLDALTHESGKVTLRGGHDLNPGGGDLAYHLTVDIANGTYTATPYTPEELRAMNARNNLKRILDRIVSLDRVTSELNRSKKSQPQMNMLSTVYYSIGFSITTEDLPQWDLARTTAAVAWADDGSTVKATYANATFFAEPLSPIYTTWYVGSTSAGLTSPVNVTTTSNFGWVYANYYNYDWFDDNLITTAYHEIEFTFYPMLPNGNVGVYDYDHVVSGEHAEGLFENAIEIDYFYTY